MEKDKPQGTQILLVMRSKVTLLFVTVFIVMGFMTPVFADESISMSCYKDWKSSWSVGTVVVFNVAEGPLACSNTYFDCRGRCIACYQDSDYVDNVCLDMQGRTFLK